MSSLPLCLASTSATRSSTSVRRVVLSSARRTLATTETSSPQSALSSSSTIRPQPRPAPAPLSSTPMTTFFHPALDPPLLNNPEQALSDSSPLGSLRRLPVDMQDFLRGYPNFMRNRWHQTNAQFFAGKVPAEPRGMLIEELLEDLERNPRSYQRDAFAASWLAPIVERNANRSGWCLQPHEVEAITQSPIQLNRYERGIRLLLRSYGIELVDMQTGLFRPYLNFANDFQHILAHPSSLLTLTRILKSLDSFYATDHFGRAPYSRLHLVPSLVLFLVAQHNAGAIDLSPNTHAGRELEERWTFCLKQRVAREVIQGIVASRRGTEGHHSTQSAATEGEAPMEEGGDRWTIAAYEQWCIARVAQAPSTTSTSRPVAPSDKITSLPVTTLSDAVRRGRWEHLVDRHWRADPLWRAENGLLRLEAAEESARRGAVDPDGGWWEVKKDAEEDETAEAKDEMDREVAFEPLVFRAGEIAGVEVGRGEREQRMQEAIGRSLSLEEDQWEEEHEEGEEEEHIAWERR